MHVKFSIFGKRIKENFSIKICRQLTCLYIGLSIFLFTFGLKYPNKLIYYAYFSKILILLIFEFGWQLGWGWCMRVYQL